MGYRGQLDYHHCVPPRVVAKALPKRVAAEALPERGGGKGSGFSDPTGPGGAVGGGDAEGATVSATRTPVGGGWPPGLGVGLLEWSPSPSRGGHPSPMVLREAPAISFSSHRKASTLRIPQTSPQRIRKSLESPRRSLTHTPRYQWYKNTIEPQMRLETLK